ncbi:hypothetical protein J8J27_32550, partial [Mycobacterium tuberculosis]|nr:hypothetical protein [Mycobacterium tuberculosis]
IPAFTAEDGGVVSSSRIRDALSRGDLGEANGLLGYRWFVLAEVVHGAKRGLFLGCLSATSPRPRDCPPSRSPSSGAVNVDGGT